MKTGLEVLLALTVTAEVGDDVGHEPVLVRERQRGGLVRERVRRAYGQRHGVEREHRAIGRAAHEHARLARADEHGHGPRAHALATHDRGRFERDRDDLPRLLAGRERRPPRRRDRDRPRRIRGLPTAFGRG